MPINVGAKPVDINSRKIINGGDADVMQLYPMRHTFAWDAYTVGNANHWLPTEISMQRDIEQWKAPNVLTADERKAMWTGSAKDRAAKVMMPPPVKRPDLSDPPSTPDFDALFDETLAVTASEESCADPVATSVEFGTTEVQEVREAHTAVTTDAPKDHHGALPNPTPARRTPPTAAFEVVVRPDPESTFGEALVTPPIDWAAREAML